MNASARFVDVNATASEDPVSATNESNAEGKDPDNVDGDDAGTCYVDVASTWRLRAWNNSEPAATQTSELEVSDAGIQAVERVEFGCQVENGGIFNEDDEEKIGGSVTAEIERRQDYKEFCEAACELMCKQLSIRTRAFDNLWGSDEYYNEGGKDCKTIHVLGKDGGEQDCTCVAWSCTGSQVVASFGRFDVCGFDETPGSVRVWNIFRRKMDPEVPDVVLDCETSILSVTCHPIWPSVIVAGTYNGQIKIWDLSLPDDPLVSSSSITDYSHRGLSPNSIGFASRHLVVAAVAARSMAPTTTWRPSARMASCYFGMLTSARGQLCPCGAIELGSVRLVELLPSHLARPVVRAQAPSSSVRREGG